MRDFDRQEPLESSTDGCCESRTPSPAPIQTPMTIRTLQRQADHLRARSLSPSTKASVDKFVKGSLVQAHAGAQAEDDLRQVQAASQARTARQSNNRRVVQKGGVITVANARQAIRAREEDELDRAQAAFERAERALQRKRTKNWKPWKELKNSVRSRATKLRQQARAAQRAQKAARRG